MKNNLENKHFVINFVYDEDPKPNDPKPDDPKPNDPKPDGTFTQEQVNSFLADEKRKWKKTQEDLVTQLETMKAEKGRSEESQQALQEQIDNLKKTYMTKEQLAKEEAQKERDSYTNKITGLETENEKWKSKYVSSKITRELNDAANAAGAVKPTQVVRDVIDSAELITDENGDDKVIVTMMSKDDDGNAVELKLTPSEAIERHKADKANNWNLYKSNITGGLGGGNDSSDESKLSDDEWFKSKAKGN